jgi:hypothetical protein
MVNNATLPRFGVGGMPQQQQQQQPGMQPGMQPMPGMYPPGAQMPNVPPQQQQQFMGNANNNNGQQPPSK